ncbi:hypothetical protein HDF08_004016 [Edaphobacter lichenicola]|uniref:Uncharacterized protein n=1 Tax=Tunturiibacter lichenicola TaxID=2051959 RepID=A0A852VJH9_9BACT|nr:hypothetical protein [Edaphobacter lichenicola]
MISNKFSSQLSWWGLLLICAIPLVLTFVWIYRREREKGRLRSLWQVHPISYSIIALIALVFFWTSGSLLIAKLRTPSKSQISAQSLEPMAKPVNPAPVPAVIPQTVAIKPVAPDVTVSPKVKLTPRSKEQKTDPPVTRNPQPAPPTENLSPAPTPMQQPSNVGCIGGSGNACVGTNQPGGVVIGTLGSVPPPDRTLSPDNVTKAVDLLKRAGSETRIFFITFPTQASDDGEIGKFTLTLENVFNKAGWNPYRERNVQLGQFRSISERSSSEGEGIGCSLPDPPTRESQLAMQALSLLGYPCTHPSVYQPFANPGQQSNFGFALYVSVGTRIKPEQ